MKRTIGPTLIHKITRPTHVDESLLLPLRLLVQSLHNRLTQRDVPRRANIDHDVVLPGQTNDLLSLVKGSVHDALHANRFVKVSVEILVSQENSYWQIGMLFLQGQDKVGFNASYQNGPMDWGQSRTYSLRGRWLQ